MWLTIGNLHTSLTRATDEERAWLREYLSFGNDKARFSGAPERTSMLHAVNDTFPSGFAAMVRKAAPLAGFDVQEIDKRTPPIARDASADLSFLRDYQRAAIERALALERGIVQQPTGSGKSVLAAALTIALPCRWLFLVHRTTLVHQMAAKYAEYTKMHAGIVAEGQWSAGDGVLTCASFQAMHAGLKRHDKRVCELLYSAQGLLVDEAHCVAAHTLYRVAMSTPNARYRIGLSATPLARGDQRSLYAVATLGPVIHRVRAGALIESGVLAKPEITLVECQQQIAHATWQGVYGAAIVRSAKRNAIVVEAVRRAEKPCLVFVKEIRHGQLVEQALGRAGIRCAFVWGSHSTEHRASAIRDLVAGRIDALVASVILNEGVDVPALRSVVVASGGQSVIAALQRIGRGMRRADGKTTFSVFDVADLGCGCRAAARDLGTPGQGLHTGCRWLERHARARRRAYQKEGHSIVVEKWLAGRERAGYDARVGGAPADEAKGAEGAQDDR